MKTKMKLFLSFLLVALTTITTIAQEVQEFSLKDAQEYAVQNSYVVQNSGLDVDIARKKIWETITMGLPQINGNAEYVKNIDAAKSPLPVAIIPKEFWPNLGIPDDTPVDATFPVSFAQKYNSSWGFSIDQLIFDGSYIVGVGSAKIYLQLATQGKEKTEIEIKHGVAQAYYMVLVAQENLTVMKENLGNSEKLLSDSKALYENGFVEEQDVDQMQLLTKKAENEILKAKREIRVAKMVLKYTMGVNVESEIELTDNLSQFIDPLLNNVESDYGFDHISHIDYRMLETQSLVSEKLLKLEKSAYLPKVNGFYSWNKMAFGDNSNLFKSSVPWFKSSMLGVNIEVPIFSAGQRISKVNQAKMEYEKSINDQKQAVQGLQKDYLSAVADIESAVDQLKNDIDNKKLASKIYDKTTIKYNNGLISSTELSQTETQYIQSQGAWVGSVLQLLNAKINLDKAIGK